MWQADNAPHPSHDLPKFFSRRLLRTFFSLTLLVHSRAGPTNIFNWFAEELQKWSSVIAKEDMELVLLSFRLGVCSLQVVFGGQSWTQYLKSRDSSGSSRPPPSLCCPPFLVVFQWRAGLAASSHSLDTEVCGWTSQEMGSHFSSHSPLRVTEQGQETGAGLADSLVGRQRSVQPILGQLIWPRTSKHGWNVKGLVEEERKEDQRWHLVNQQIWRLCRRWWVNSPPSRQSTLLGHSPPTRPRGDACSLRYGSAQCRRPAGPGKTAVLASAAERLATSTAPAGKTGEKQKQKRQTFSHKIGVEFSGSLIHFLLWGHPRGSHGTGLRLSDQQESI